MIIINQKTSMVSLTLEELKELHHALSVLKEHPYHSSLTEKLKGEIGHLIDSLRFDREDESY